jgi:hypothetical protein
VVRDESFVVHIELFDGFAARTAQYFRGHDIETCHVVVRELELWVHDAA